MINVIHITVTVILFMLFAISYILKVLHPNSSNWWVVVVIFLLFATAFVAAWSPA